MPQSGRTVALAGLLVVAVALAVWWRCGSGVGEGYKSQRRRVCILMFSTPNIVDEYAGHAAAINEQYARRHGYSFLHLVQPSSHPIPQWEKVRLVRDHLPSYDAVFWIDSDAAFNQHDVSLDRWLSDPADIVGCTDVPNGPYKINCGTMLMKNTEWVRGFMTTWWSMCILPKYNKWANEQEALHDLLVGNVHGCANRVKIEAVDAFNSSYPELANGRRDTFVLHFMAMPADVRRRELMAMRKRMGI
jgi:hypothetical protein